MTTAISDADRELIRSWAHLTLPASATALRHDHARGADPAIWARFELPRAARAELLASAGFPETLSTTRRSVRTSMRRDLPWWRPDDLTPFESGERLQEDRRPRYGSHLLLGGEGETLTVYVFVTGL